MVAGMVLEGTGRAVGRVDAARGAADKGREGQSVLSKEVKDEATRRRRLPGLWYGHYARCGGAVMGFVCRKGPVRIVLLSIGATED